MEEFTSLVNPGRPISPAASDVNGITDEMVEDAPDFKQVLSDFSDFAGDLALVGHNIYRFDLPFLYRDAKQYWGKTIGNDFVDTLQMAKIVLPILGTYGLGRIAEFYAIDTAGAHRALADCHMTQKVYEKLREEKDHMVDQGSLRVCNCGSLMVPRSSAAGRFWGCTRFPECRNTVNIMRTKPW